MRPCLLTLLLLICTASQACRCIDLGSLSKSELDKTDYIALVKVKHILPYSADSVKMFNDPYLKIVVEELRHYKGGRASEIIVQGGHEKFRTWTSCDYGIGEGDEWVIFAQYDQGKPTVKFCGRSVGYRKSNGFRDWQFSSGFKELAFLDSAFGKPLNNISCPEGVETVFYPNGQREKVAQYAGGQLHGTVEYFYPNGQPYGKLQYQHGQLHGSSRWYYRDGSLQLETRYKAGMKVDTSFYYIPSPKGPILNSLHVYNQKGENLYSRFTGGTYKEQYLEQENIYDPILQKRTTIEYHSNGQVAYRYHTVKGKPWGASTEYDKEGKIIRQRHYEENGKLIRN
jgi:antitoxin component YwqK of YwqJK toxin-antitoxin module